MGQLAGAYSQQQDKRGAPLRKIVERLHESGSIFEPDWLRLECGHEVRSKAKRRVRCFRCKEAEAARTG